ncbi:MAG: hypothetical protein LBL23_05570 [Coriobacteriales bacterium]|jgi:hypothetical protein|nr:hypothetical protein [Coriobacteriales bacterium]
MKRTTYKRATAGLLSLVFVLASLGFGSTAIAADDTQTVTVDVKSYIGLTTTTPSTIDLTPAAAAASGESTSTATINCNDNDGYTLTIKMNVASSNLVSGGDAIPTGGASSAAVGDLSDNTWGFKGGLVTIYTAMPTSSGTAATLASTSSTASADVTTVTFGAKVTNTQPTGSYSGTVLFTALPKP